MLFDIKSDRAKSMASRLQAFLTETPKTKLTRSSAIEAVATMLGFNNRNEMLARLDQETGETPAQPRTAHPLSETSTRCDQALKDLVGELEWACAQDLVNAVRRSAPDAEDLEQAAQREPEDGGDTALIEVEDDWARNLRAGSPAWLVAIQGYSSQWDDHCLEVRQDAAQAAALALVNGALRTAREIWDGRLAPDGPMPEDENPFEAETAPADLRQEADAIERRLHGLFLGLVERCARTLIQEARRIAPDEPDFRTAIHLEEAGSGTHALLTTEESWEQELGHRVLYRRAVETFAETELEGAREVRVSKRDALALALVNESIERAEDLWTAARASGFDGTREYDVDVSCWAPASLQVELPGDRVGDIDAEVLCLAQIQVFATDEDDAISRAQTRLERYDYFPIWNPRPDRGVRNARWSGDARGDDLDDYLAREDLLVEDHWRVETDRAGDFKADQVVDRD